MLREATGAELPGAVVAALTARTEGWAAGLQLAGLSLRGHADPAGLEIRVLLAAGMPNPRIADELVVSLDTVKRHVSHLLGKLGAANRTEAVTRARQLGLMP